jgi:thymidylate kinase
MSDYKFSLQFIYSILTEYKVISVINELLSSSVLKKIPTSTVRKLIDTNLKSDFLFNYFLYKHCIANNTLNDFRDHVFILPNQFEKDKGLCNVNCLFYNYIDGATFFMKNVWYLDRTLESISSSNVIYDPIIHDLLENAEYFTSESVSWECKTGSDQYKKMFELFSHPIDKYIYNPVSFNPMCNIDDIVFKPKYVNEELLSSVSDIIGNNLIDFGNKKLICNSQKQNEYTKINEQTTSNNHKTVDERKTTDVKRKTTVINRETSVINRETTVVNRDTAIIGGTGTIFGRREPTIFGQVEKNNVTYDYDDIIIEGLDNSGKDYLADKIIETKQFLGVTYDEIIKINFPIRDGIHADDINSFLKGDIEYSNEVEMWFLENRLEFLNKKRQYDNKKKTLFIFVRSGISYLVYKFLRNIIKKSEINNEMEYVKNTTIIFLNTEYSNDDKKELYDNNDDNTKSKIKKKYNKVFKEMEIKFEEDTIYDIPIKINIKKLKNY